MLVTYPFMCPTDGNAGWCEISSSLSQSFQVSRLEDNCTYSCRCKYQCSRLRRCNAAVFWNHDRTADSELRFLRVLANSRRMDRTTFSDVHTRCELKLQANMCFLSAAQFKSFPGGLTLIDPLSPQSKLKCGKAAFSFYEPQLPESFRSSTRLSSVTSGLKIYSLPKFFIKLKVPYCRKSLQNVSFDNKSI